MFAQPVRKKNKETCQHEPDFLVQHKNPYRKLFKPKDGDTQTLAGWSYIGDCDLFQNGKLSQFPTRRYEL